MNRAPGNTWLAQRLGLHLDHNGLHGTVLSFDAAQRAGLIQPCGNPALRFAFRIPKSSPAVTFKRGQVVAFTPAAEQFTVENVRSL